MSKFSYQSFCWVIGTTSFRMINFNRKIEEQLSLLNEFRQNVQGWTFNEQKLYYDFLRDKDFLIGDAKRPEKDARQKTSGLVDIGLVDEKRDITDVGFALLKIVEDGNYPKDNPLQIASDSFIYLKQLLKTYNKVGNNVVRPFVVFLYLISKLEYLSKDEFTYLLPLCINKDTTDKILKNIIELRNGSVTIDEIIISIIFAMENYQEALDYFQKSKVDEKVICQIGMNRKSQDNDKPYYELYNAIKSGDFKKIVKACTKLKGKAASLWRMYLIKGKSKTNSEIYNAKNEKKLKEIFFKKLHLFKAKSTLEDYFDLNRRYFKTTDIVRFEDGKIVLDMLPNCFFHDIAEQLPSIAFEKDNNLFKNVRLEEIADFLKINEDKLFKDLEKRYGLRVKNKEDILKIIQDERYKRFDKLIEERFKIEKLIELLTHFENRNDEAIRDYVTDNAEVPTIFEYIMGVAWYWVSGRKGSVLDYMRLSLDADLLPKSHASGGSADIEYLYENTTDYPKHALLIEATLSEKDNQRRMEMEPVSRHLGDYILQTDDSNSYCLFISTYLNLNVISDFRGRKNNTYYSKDGAKEVKGLKILVLNTSELKTILENNISYKELYKLFEEAYNSVICAKEWYEKEIREKIIN